MLARDLQGRLGLADAPEVDLRSDPPPNMLLGRFDGGKVAFAPPEIGGVRPDEVMMDLEPFSLDVLGSVASRRLESHGPLSGLLRVELSEEEVASILASSEAAAIPVKYVRLEEGYLVVGSEVKVLGARVPVDVEGELALQDGKIRFEPRRVKAVGAPVPDRLVRGLLGGRDFAYPMGEMASDATISGIETHEGRVVLTGEMTLPAG